MELAANPGDLYRRPEWYNTVEHNCVTSLVPMITAIQKANYALLNRHRRKHMLL